jgi:hypothetical protein
MRCLGPTPGRYRLDSPMEIPMGSRIGINCVSLTGSIPGSSTSYLRRTIRASGVRTFPRPINRALSLAPRTRPRTILFRRSHILSAYYLIRACMRPCRLGLALIRPNVTLVFCAGRASIYNSSTFRLGTPLAVPQNNAFKRTGRDGGCDSEIESASDFPKEKTSIAPARRRGATLRDRLISAADLSPDAALTSLIRVRPAPR